MDIRRIVALWEDCRARFGEGGPFLFGLFSKADAMHGAARAYADAILALLPMGQRFAAAKAEPGSMAENDAA